MPTLIEGLLFGWNKNLEYGTKLIADLSDEQMTAQPAPDTNHPAWIFSHLGAYHPVIVSVIRGEEFDDPKEHRFGMLSKPESDAGLYPTKAQLQAAWAKGHADVAAALSEHGEVALERSIRLERWKTIMPKSGIALPYLMLIHENIHLGQLSAWRRVQGLPPV